MPEKPEQDFDYRIVCPDGHPWPDDHSNEADARLEMAEYVSECGCEQADGHYIERRPTAWERVPDEVAQ
jgi:hypothetical protein